MCAVFCHLYYFKNAKEHSTLFRGLSTEKQFGNDKTIIRMLVNTGKM